MWFLVSVAKGSKYFESDSQINNKIMISDTTDMVVSGTSTGSGSYRFEMRKGNEAFVMQDFPQGVTKETLLLRFSELAGQLGARSFAIAEPKLGTGALSTPATGEA